MDAPARGLVAAGTPQPRHVCRGTERPRHPLADRRCGRGRMAAPQLTHAECNEADADRRHQRTGDKVADAHSEVIRRTTATAAAVTSVHTATIARMAGERRAWSPPVPVA